jgi:cytosine deaminase
MLEVVLISAHAAHLATHDDLSFALDAITSNAARSWCLDAYGVRPGARADLVLVEATSWEEALRLQAARSRVWFRGRPVAETQVTSRLLG